MKNGWLEHIDNLIQSHCVGGGFCYSEKERNDAAVKALNSTATALTDVATYLRMLATDLPELRQRRQADRPEGLPSVIIAALYTAILLADHLLRYEGPIRMLSAKRIDLLRAVFEHPFDSTSCFLCAEPLNTETRTEEHVIPKWVQQKYELLNERLRLLNDTFIPYRQLTIPCCNTCNNQRLSELELTVQTAVSSGYEAVVALPKFTLFQWLAKIFVGLLYKDLLLPLDRSDRSVGNIIEAETLKRFSIMHLWIQMANLTTERGDANEYCPGSIFLFRTQKPQAPKDQFDIVDSTLANCLAIRLGDVGMVADFLENGVHARMAGDYFLPYQSFPLHPFQFKELAARIFYGASLIDMQTDVEFFGNSDGLQNIIFFWQPKENSSPREWKNEEYAQLLANVMRFSENQQVFDPTTDRVWSCLHNEYGSIRKLSL